MQRAFLSLIIVLFVVSNTEKLAYAQQLTKACKREVKRQKKEFKQKGHTIMNSSMSLDASLQNHCMSLRDANTWGMNQSTEGLPMNMCLQKNLFDAHVRYATMASSFIVGKIESLGGLSVGEGTDPKEAKVLFETNYRSMVQKNVSGIISESFNVGKRSGTDNYLVETYFLVNEERARQARLRALEDAKKSLEDANMKVIWDKKLMEFVEQYFDLSGM